MKNNRLNRVCVVSAFCASICLPQTEAADVTLNWSSPVEVANSSTKALNGKAFTDKTGNKSPSVQFEVITAGLPAGTYTATFDFKYADKPDQQRSAMRGSNGDGNAWDRQVTISGTILNTWYRATGTVVITGTEGDNWTGKYDLKPTIFGNANDDFDTFDVFFDNVNLTDTNGTSVLRYGLYDFENNTVGNPPTNVSYDGFNQFSEIKVVEIIEPTSVFVASIALNAQQSEATITWNSVVGELFDVYRSVDLEFTEPAIATDVPGTEGTTSYVDASLPTGGKAFYRVFRK